jgi:hypothetical protein
MLQIAEDNRKYAELTAGLNKAREIGDIAEMWRCASKLVAMDRRRCARLHVLSERRREPRSQSN